MVGRAELVTSAVGVGGVWLMASGSMVLAVVLRWVSRRRGGMWWRLGRRVRARDIVGEGVGRVVGYRGGSGGAEGEFDDGGALEGALASFVFEGEVEVDAGGGFGVGDEGNGAELVVVVDGAAIGDV